MVLACMAEDASQGSPQLGGVGGFRLRRERSPARTWSVL